MKTVYLLAYQDFAYWAINNGCHTINSSRFRNKYQSNQLSKKKHKLQWKINKAIQHGVQVKEYKDFDPLLENQMKNTIHTWLKQRRGPQMHLGKINFFNSDAEKRIFYAATKR